MEARIREINWQLHETRRAITFPEMFQKVAETRLGPDVYRALIAKTAQRLAQIDRETIVRTVAMLAALLLIAAACSGPTTLVPSQATQPVKRAVQATLVAEPSATSTPTPTPVPATSAPPSMKQPVVAATTLTVTPTTLPTVMLTEPPAASPVPFDTPNHVLSATPAQGPSIVTDKTINLRAGPGTRHPLVGTTQAGQTYAIQSKLADGTWLEICCVEQHSAWILASLATTYGDMARVQIAGNIPTPPAAPTPAPAPTQPPAPAAPVVPAGMPYVVKSVRLRAVKEGLQTCTAGDHLIIATVVDAAGKPIDGVRVRELWTNTTHVSGDRGPGVVEWAIWKNGGGKLQIVDDGGQPLSPVTREMSNAWPDVDLMMAAGYCACESFDEAACAAALQSHSRYFTFGHYVYEVVFQRTP